MDWRPSNSAVLRYLRSDGRFLLPLALLLAVGWSLPPFTLFADRDAGMLQLHLLQELFSIAVSLLVAVMAWHDFAQNPARNSGLLVAGFVAVALTDLAHALSYDGMPPLVVENSTQRAAYFWLVGRALAAATMLLIALDGYLRLPRLSRLAWLLLGAGLAAIGFAAGTWWLDRVPALYVPQLGVTPLKRFCEYALVALDVSVAGLFIARAEHSGNRQANLFASSCLVMAMGEVVFANFKGPADFLNTLGHLFKVVSYVFLYQALFVQAVRAPYLRIRESNERFRALTELSSDWYFRLDTDLRFADVSPGVSMITRRDLVGTLPWDLMPRHGGPEWDLFRQHCLAGEPVRHRRLPFRTDEGEVRWFSVSCSPLQDEQGRLAGMRGVCTDVTERVEYDQKLEELAFFDPVTRLPNSLKLEESLALARMRLSGTDTCIALLVLNIDNFRTLNELGHAAGDDALRTLGLRLSAALAPSDVVAHLGGDEFAVLACCRQGPQQAIPLAVRLMNAVRQPMVLDGRDCDVTASVGIAIWPSDSEGFDGLRSCADAAMRRAKQAGKDTFRVHDETMRRADSDRLALRNALRRALDREEFELHYQPQRELRSGRIVGVEALIRWNHPERGLLSPFHFIAAAEEFGLIIPIGRWVLQAACRQAAEWNAAGLPPLGMAVNCSALQFRRGSLIDDVADALRASQLPPDQLELELTESILLEDNAQLLASAHQLKRIGVRLAIDDFGTGSSNFGYLRKLGIATLKIDQSFVRDMLTSAEDATIVSTMIQLAERLGMTAIAEGVESQEAADALLALGCSQAQGYHLGRPMSAAALAALLMPCAAQQSAADPSPP